VFCNDIVSAVFPGKTVFLCPCLRDAPSEQTVLLAEKKTLPCLVSVFGSTYPPPLPSCVRLPLPCNTLQHTAPQCYQTPATFIHHTATLLQHTTSRGNTLQHTATLLQRTASRSNTRATHCLGPLYLTHCNTLHHAATHCNTLQHTATHCTTLQHTATQYNTLQHNTTHCNSTMTHCNSHFDI